MSEVTQTGTVSLCDASQSDCPAVHQLFSRSRTVRKRRRPSSAFFVARTLRWSKRQERSLQQHPIEPTLSEEESEKPLTLPTLHRTKRNLAALKSLPRPSEIVHEVEAGSAPEAGLPKHLKQAHYRRVRATTLQMQYLNTQGKPQPVPTWSRINRGLIAYSPYLQPPPGDRELKLLRTPKQLLSKYYRGTLLKVYRPGDHRPANSKRKRNGSASPCSDPAVSMVDFMYWATTSDDDIVTANDAPEFPSKATAQLLDEEHRDSHLPKTRVANGNEDKFAPLPCTAAEIEARRSKAEVMLSRVGEQFQKRSYIQEIMKLAQMDDDSLPSETDTSSVAPSPLASESEKDANTNLQQEEQEDPEKTRDRELLRLLQGDMDEEFEVPKEAGEDVVKENGVCNPRNHEVREEREELTKEVSAEPEKLSSSFEKDRKIAMMFCQATNKRPRAQAFLDATTLPQSDKRIKTGAKTKSQAPEPYAMKVLKKMGFRGRLGAREDGRSAPLEATVKASRSGLGAQPKQVVSYGRHLLVENQQSQSRGSGRSHRSVEPVNVDPGPIPEEGADGVTGNTADRHSDIPSASPNGVFSNTKEIRSGIEGGKPKHRSNNFPEDPEYEWETDAEDKLVDNSRRAIIIDMDAVVKNNHERRKEAFKNMLTESGEFLDKKLDLDDLYARVSHDLTDEDTVKALLGHFHISASDEKLNSIMERLDACYESLGPCELVENFRYCKVEDSVSCGLLHRGTERRMKREMKELGLQESDIVFCTFQSREAWPYMRTWKDMFCRLGVSPRQGSIISLRTASIVSAGVAAAVLGARIETSSLTGNQNGVDSQEKFKRMVEQLLCMSIAPLPRRRRVLFLSEADNMWYSGSVQFEEANRALVCSYGSNSLVWTDRKSVIGLSRASFRKLKCIDFGGLLEPEDVECL